LICVALISACGGSSDSTTTIVVVEPAASTSPELAVSAIIRAIGRQDGQTLDANTLTDQLGLLALVEGASTADALAALGFASQQVASTFWRSFAGDIGNFVDAGVEDIRIGEVSTFDVGGATYATVDVSFPLDQADRVFVLTDRAGWRVDLVATFPGAFVPNIPLAVERASSPGVDPELLASIRRQATSLDVLDAIGVDERTSEAITEARERMGVLPGG
jgi:hypothetical protein